ncbi:hypothetical protein CMV_007520 [Castanea mollissima]|uniref:Uncharacterized protein n=1 Tax=Castanea mollissima TaxID=60419 RepID=A0A8J4W085_9ROSI|nr:hypothetical protein CMV_007520 [Castanea mollissima]
MSNSRFSTPKSRSSSASSSSPPSSSTFSLPLRDEDSLPYQKFGCILIEGSCMALEWLKRDTKSSRPVAQRRRPATCYKVLLDPKTEHFLPEGTIIAGLICCCWSIVYRKGIAVGNGGFGFRETLLDPQEVRSQPFDDMVCRRYGPWDEN